MCGFAELLEFLNGVPTEAFEKAARATCDFYIANTPSDGIPYWDTGAPGLDKLGDWRARPADPFNPWEPVDSSAAAIAAQGLLRLGHHLRNERYWNAGLSVADALFDAPYLSANPAHQGLICIRSITVPTAGTPLPANRPCGAIITRANWRSTFCGSLKTGLT